MWKKRLDRSSEVSFSWGPELICSVQEARKITTGKRNILSGDKRPRGRAKWPFGDLQQPCPLRLSLWAFRRVPFVYSHVLHSEIAECCCDLARTGTSQSPYKIGIQTIRFRLCLMLQRSASSFVQAKIKTFRLRPKETGYRAALNWILNTNDKADFWILTFVQDAVCGFIATLVLSKNLQADFD